MTEILDALRNDPSLLDKLSQEQKVRAVELIKKLQEHQKYNFIDSLFPDEGPLRRELYPKHMEFFFAPDRERFFIAANRVGKSVAGAYECALHMTGLYPEWWEGNRFNKPVRCWMGNTTNTTVRDINQRAMLGDFGCTGTGMLRKELIERAVRRAGVPDAIENIQVRHVSGGISTGTFKSYEQGREAWQGEEVHVIWADEEITEEVLEEASARTMTTKGIIFCTFTPLLGLTPVIQKVLHPEDDYHPFYTHVAWEDVPHLSEDEIKRMLSKLSPHMVKARSKGFPALGTGLVFPVLDSDIVIDPIQVPDYWPRIGGIDFGIDHATAYAEVAYDADNDIIYLIKEYKRKGETPLVHSAAIKSWVPVAWPRDGLQRDKGSGIELAQHYRSHGVKLLHSKFENPEGGEGVEAGLMQINERMQTGRFKVFSSCQEFLKEKSMYHRKDGQVLKLNDDLMSATRYAAMSIQHAHTRPIKTPRRAKHMPATSVGY